MCVFFSQEILQENQNSFNLAKNILLEFFFPLGQIEAMGAKTYLVTEHTGASIKFLKGNLMNKSFVPPMMIVPIANKWKPNNQGD